MKNLQRLSKLMVVLFLLSILATSCFSQRKCNGKKVIKTPMGNM